MSPDKFRVYGWHKSFGIAILMLAALRLAWKLRNMSPKLPSWMSKFDVFAAESVHTLLYVIIFVMPLSGWAMSSASGLHVSFFGLFTLPDLVAPDKPLAGFLRQFHNIMAWVIIGVVSLHAFAALLHHFYYKDNILRKMLPFGKLKEENDAHDTRPAGFKL